MGDGGLSLLEQLTLDGVALNDGTTYTLEAVSVTPPPPREEWISGADSDGALLAREPHHENREITAQIRIEPQATMNLALQKIAALVDKLQECRRQANGLALTWIPANSTLPTLTFRCLSGQVTEIPIDIANGWFVNAPLVSVKMTCLPYGEGPEAQVATVTSSAPLIVLPDITALGGDVPALGRLVVLDAASKDRRTVMWGLESRYYPTTSPPSLIVDSSSMVTTGFSGITQTRTGAYSGATNNVISATLQTQPQAVCGLGNLSHVGSFRPQLRFYATTTDMYVRLTYQVLDGPPRSLSYKVPAALGFNEVDLGLITVPETQMGTQRWTGRIEAYRGPTGGGGQIDIDAVWMMPAELFGRARATYSYKIGALSAFDEFASMAAGTVINARVAPVGGTWGTAGAGTDFAAADAPASTDETMARSAVSDTGIGRFAILGSTNYTNTEVGARIRTAITVGGASPSWQLGIFARYVDVNNNIRLTFGNTSFLGLGLRVRVAGVDTVVALASSLSIADATWYGLRIVAYASGRVYGTLLDASGGTLYTLSLTDAAVATGGALATGKPGILDYYPGSTATVTRYYDNFYASVPTAEPIVCYSGRTIEFRDDDTLRQDSTGTYAGAPPEYVGARFKIPNAGGPARETRVAVIARRNDVETAGDDDLVSNATTDSTTVTAFATPRYLVVPR